MDSIHVSHIYVGNLPLWATDQDLLEVFSTYGAIRRCKVPRCGRYNISFGFVTYCCQDSAIAALRSHIYLGGKRLCIEIARGQAPPRLRHLVGHSSGDYSGASGGYDRGGYSNYRDNRDGYLAGRGDRHDNQSPSPRTFTHACSRSPRIEFGANPLNCDRRSGLPGTGRNGHGHHHRSRTSSTYGSRRRRYRRSHHHRRCPSSGSDDSHDGRSRSPRDRRHH
ncbi:hypothetical protein BGZ82_007698 [Podila clonocystis]|nr:hypothetical protein BGZ82_007698 [Podila clonocystis]